MIQISKPYDIKRMLMVAWIVFSLVLYISCDDEEGCPPGTETIRDSNGDIVDCFSLIEDT